MPNRVFHQPVFQFCGGFENHGSVAPTGNGHDFGVSPGADDDDLPTLFLCSGYQFVDAADKGTGGIDNLKASGLQFFVDFPGNAVGTDDDGTAGGNVLRAGNFLDSQFLKPANYVMIVDNGTQGHGLFAFFYRFLHQSHGPVHTEAEAGGFCQNNVHFVSPRA